MDFSTIKGLTIPEGDVAKITADGCVLWEKPASYKNWVFYSTEADGVTVYNSGKGYKDGYRVRSGGGEAEQSFTTITGYIPYKKGNRLYIYPQFVGENTSNTINFYDNSFTNLGQVTDADTYYGFCNSSFKTEAVNGVSVLDLSEVTVSGIDNVAYVRIGNTINDGSATGLKSPIKSGSEMIITKDEEISWG